MSFRSILVVLLALVCGVSAAVGIKQLQGKSPGSATAEVETVDVVVAVADLHRYNKITEEMVRIEKWPKDKLPGGAVLKREDVVGRVVKIPMVEGDIVIDKKISTKDEGTDVGSNLPPGMRAFTISTPTPSANVAGFLLPGSHVDVYLTIDTRQEKDDTEGALSVLLLSNMKIIASGKTLQAPAGNRVEQLQSVTLEVTDKQAALLNLAIKEGNLTLALRNSADKEPADPSDAVATRKQLRTLMYQGLPKRRLAARQPKAAAGPVAAPRPDQTAKAADETELRLVQLPPIRTIRGNQYSQITAYRYERPGNDSSDK